MMRELVAAARGVGVGRSERPRHRRLRRLAGRPVARRRPRHQPRARSRRRATSGLCCCHVTGQARNDNSVAVHVTIKFSAFNAPPGPNAPAEPLSTILYFIKDLQPGQTHQIEAPGFIFPCNQIPEGIRNVKTEVEVKGITYPPF